MAQLNRDSRVAKRISRVVEPAKAFAARGNRCRSPFRGRPTVAHLFALGWAPSRITEERGLPCRVARVAMGFAFGSFTEICQTAALIVCPLVGSSNGLTGISPTCYSRNVELAKTVIFQPATCFMHIVALIMLLIMVRAVARRIV